MEEWREREAVGCWRAKQQQHLLHEGEGQEQGCCTALCCPCSTSAHLRNVVLRDVGEGEAVRLDGGDRCGAPVGGMVQAVQAQRMSGGGQVQSGGLCGCNRRDVGTTRESGGGSVLCKCVSPC